MNVSSCRLAVVCCLLSVMPIADGAPSNSGPNLPPDDRALIAEAYSLWSAVADDIWPGASRVKSPFVYVSKQHEYAIGFPRLLDGFRPNGDTLLGQSIQVRERSLAVDLSASFPLQGVPAVMMGSPEALGKSVASWIITAGHEMFHVFQAANGAYGKIDELEIGPKRDSSWRLSFAFPYGEANVMRLIHLQGYLTWLAAQSTSSEDAKYNIGTVVDATRVYRMYLSRLSGDDRAYRYSQYQEWNEGVAAYFEYKLAEKAAASTYRPTENYSVLPLFQSYENLWREAYQSRPFLAKHAGRAAKTRTAFYHLGAGKAVALDKVDAAWKKKYFLPGIWLDDLLADVNEEAR